MPVALRPDFDGARLRRIARENADGNQVRRLLASRRSMMARPARKRPGLGA
jgi:hypothetical protein